MASEVDISNLALSHLGDSATVASLDPPEGSSQAEHCARWYPIARNAVQELHDWSFCTARVALAQLDNPWSEWTYCYAVPSDAQNLVAVLAPDAADDQSVAITLGETYYGAQQLGTGIYTPQPFITETAADGTPVIYTNQIDAVLRYTRIVTDSTRFSALFVMTLARYLASLLAGPVLKGDTGIQVGAAQLKMAMAMLSAAAVSDANDKRQPITQSVTWMVGR